MFYAADIHCAPRHMIGVCPPGSDTKVEPAAPGSGAKVEPAAPGSGAKVEPAAPGSGAKVQSLATLLWGLTPVNTLLWRLNPASMVPFRLKTVTFISVFEFLLFTKVQRCKIFHQFPNNFS